MVPWRTFNINGIFSLHKMYFIVEKGSMFMVLLRTVWGTVFWGTHKGACMASWWKPPIFFLLFFLKIYFWRFCLLFDRTVDRQETKLEREGGDGIGKGPRAGTRTRDAQSATRYMSTRCPQGYQRRRKPPFKTFIFQIQSYPSEFWMIYKALLRCCYSISRWILGCSGWFLSGYFLVQFRKVYLFSDMAWVALLMSV